jgi:radical SAM protein with 4Fe4S-binding SPASM domain
MKTIITGKDTVCKIMGKQTIKNTQYRMMNYVLKADCEDGSLLLNVITGQMVLLTPSEMEIVTSLPSNFSETMEDLIKDYYLVPLRFDEKRQVQMLRKLIDRLFAPKGINGYTILTTTNCNARCFYCYQAGYSHINLDKSTASNLIDFMVDHKGDTPLKLHWFGGEPLIGIERIDQICEGLQSKGIDYISLMISNGYLFNEEIVERARNSWKLTSVQITIDGTEDVYNRTKAYVKPNGSPYKRVLNNIQLLINTGIRVLIRINLDMHNITDLRALIDELYNRFKNQKLIEIYVHVLFNNEGQTPVKRTPEITSTLFERMTELNMYLQKLGLSNIQDELPSLKIHSCMADRSGTAVVYPNGYLYKCEHILHDDEFGYFGHIDKGIINTSVIQRFQEIYELDACKTCELYPSCVILKECNGVEDYNDYTCLYRHDSYRNTMITKYHNSIHNSTINNLL